MFGTADVTSKMKSFGLSDDKTPASDDVEANLRILTQLYFYFKSLRCRVPTCQTQIPLVNVKDHIKSWLAGAHGPQPAQISGLVCKSQCKKYTCIGCLGKPTLGIKSVVTPFATINNCCDQGRLFGIWILLARFDEVEIEIQRKFSQNARRSSGRMRTDTGTGYGNTTQWRWTPSCGPMDYQQQDNLTDTLMTQLLVLLTALIPMSDSNLSFDKEPPAAIFSLFRLTLLFDRVTALIRNDSIADMTERSQLYQAVLAFVTAIAKHPKLVRIITEKRPGKRQYAGLQVICEQGGLRSLTTASFDGSSGGLAASLITCGRSTYKQAKAYAALASKAAMKGELRSGESQESLSICRRIIEFYDMVKRTAPESLRHSNEKSKDVWNEYNEENRVTFTDAALQDHIFHNEFANLYQFPPGRMTALGKELANLTTSLPPGIFLKAGESRQDVMKVLIIGAEESPYAGGLFIFDLFLPYDWPRVPPKIYCVLEEGLDRRSTYLSAENQYRFNPNMHPDGKICLSLLNTWPGSPDEQWQPNKSTLLSVFVSIQAMILGAPHPYLNEPGVENMPHSRTFSELSTSYTQNVQCKTVLYAMLWWLYSDRAKKSVWGDISEMYWDCKGNEVLNTVREWAKSNEWLRKYDKKTPQYFQTRYYGQVAPQGTDLVMELEKYLGSSWNGAMGGKRLPGPRPAAPGNAGPRGYRF